MAALVLGVSITCLINHTNWLRTVLLPNVSEKQFALQNSPTKFGAENLSFFNTVIIIYVQSILCYLHNIILQFFNLPQFASIMYAPISNFVDATNKKFNVCLSTSFSSSFTSFPIDLTRIRYGDASA